MVNDAMFYALGSTNAAKEAAARSSLDRYMEEYRLEPVDVDPGIGAMPMRRTTAREGALTRARRAATSREEADRGIGIEGYVEAGAFLSVWATVTADGEVLGEAGASRIRLPEQIASRLPEEELGAVIADVIGEDGIREQEGTVGVLTDGRLTRAAFTEQALDLALERVAGYEF